MATAKQVVSDPFARPSEIPSGSGLKIADLEGALVIVRPEDEEIELETKLGEAKARPAQILVVTGELAANEWQEILLFGAGLKAQAGSAVRSGKPIVGVIGKGTPQPGKSAPWLFVDPDDDQLELARKAWAATAPF